MVAILATRCLELGWFPTRFKRAKTIVLPKPGKPPSAYQTPGGYSPIALLPTLGKVVESVMARKICQNRSGNTKQNRVWDLGSPGRLKGSEIDDQDVVLLVVLIKMECPDGRTPILVSSATVGLSWHPLNQGVLLQQDQSGCKSKWLAAR